MATRGGAELPSVHKIAHDAFERRDATAVRSLFEQYPELLKRINEPLFAFDSPAIVAFAGDPAIVDVLLDFGADPNRRSDWWAGGFSLNVEVVQRDLDCICV